MTSPDTIDGNSYDVVVIGGGPAGATVATLLQRAGLGVAVFERQRFPRFHVGESLLPANLPIFDRLGCHERLRQAGFMVKRGATLYDEYEGRGTKVFAFRATSFQPAFAYNVVRAQFDEVLLQHAASEGVSVYQQHTVQHTRIGPDNVTVQVRNQHGVTGEVQTKLLVDASGRAAFLGSSFKHRQPLPDLGKVALFAHFRGGRRDPSIPAGNIRLYLLRDGWAWWIPFADGLDSVGCVLHASVVKKRQASLEALFAEVLASSPRLSQGFADAQRLTPVYTTANFSYRVSPMVGDRYLALGDAAGFVDPIFSAGVLIAMRSAELAATVIVAAFHQQDFRAARFRPYVTRLQHSVAPFLALIRRFYEPACLDLLFIDKPPLRVDYPALWVVSGAAFDHQPLWLRGGLLLFCAMVVIRKAMRWWAGLPVASRWSW